MGDKAGAITALILAVFRVNGRLIDAGNALVGDIGLTSARWQVLGALTLAQGPLTVSGIARAMGLARQSVQRLADAMAADGLVRFAPNPQHQRAKLVRLTDAGAAAFEQASARQRPWARALARGLSDADIATATALLAALDRRLAPTEA